MLAFFSLWSRSFFQPGRHILYKDAQYNLLESLNLLERSLFKLYDLIDFLHQYFLLYCTNGSYNLEYKVRIQYNEIHGKNHNNAKEKETQKILNKN